MEVQHRDGYVMRERKKIGGLGSVLPLILLACGVGLILGMSGCVGAPTGMAEVRIGVLDAQRVLNRTKAGQEAQETLNEFVKARQALIELEEKDLKRMESSLLKQASVLSPNARREREEKFRRRMIQYQQRVGELNREVQEKQREVLGGFRKKVEKVVATVAQKSGLVLVIEKGQGGPTVYSDVSVDISREVIAEFNRNSK